MKGLQILSTFSWPYRRLASLDSVSNIVIDSPPHGLRAYPTFSIWHLSKRDPLHRRTLRWSSDSSICLQDFWRIVTYLDPCSGSSLVFLHRLGYCIPAARCQRTVKMCHLFPRDQVWKDSSHGPCKYLSIGWSIIGILLGDLIPSSVVHEPLRI